MAFLFDCNISTYSIRVVLISDTHSQHERLGQLPHGDLLIHAGVHHQTVANTKLLIHAFFILRYQTVATAKFRYIRKKWQVYDMNEYSFCYFLTYSNIGNTQMFILTVISSSSLLCSYFCEDMMYHLYEHNRLCWLFIAEWFESPKYIREEKTKRLLQILQFKVILLSPVLPNLMNISRWPTTNYPLGFYY